MHLSADEIRPDAIADNAIWHIGDPALGYQQLIQEQLPRRLVQLTQVYGPGGPIPLIPDTQPPTATVT